VSTRLPGFTAQHHANTLWALATLHCRPSVAWLDRLLLASQRSLPSASLQALGASIWALGCLGHRPPAPWLAAFLQQCFGRVLQQDSLAFANMVWCVASVDLEGLGTWLEAFLNEGAGESGAPCFAAIRLVAAVIDRGPALCCGLLSAVRRNSVAASKVWMCMPHTKHAHVRSSSRLPCAPSCSAQ
jgi:hypothetical protein